MCDRLPSSIGSECDTFIDTYGDALLFLLSQELDPSTFCVTLQLCPASEEDAPAIPDQPYKGISRIPDTAHVLENSDL